MAVFSEAFLRLRQDFDQAHENREKLIHDIRDNVREMARQTGGSTHRAGQQPPRRVHGDDHGPARQDQATSRADAAASSRSWQPISAKAAQFFNRRQPAGQRGSRRR